ncbi:unnamed protein product [Larinioides sclopetarius]|uniref:Uncharacterized protein n=1 Tax=Larinioides sclopetarius TaxID=280406 RepID=A0AAV1ZPU3_9ARAC
MTGYSKHEMCDMGFHSAIFCSTNAVASFFDFFVRREDLLPVTDADSATPQGVLDFQELSSLLRSWLSWKR